VLLFPVFTIQFTRFSTLNKTSTWIFLSIIPLLFFIALITNPLHGLVHNNEILLEGDPFNALRYEFTPLVWIFSIYSYIILGAAIARLLVNFFKTAPIYRAQVGAVVIGAGIPILGTIFVLFGVTFSFQRDISPITIAVGNLIVAWGLFRYRLFDLVPVAWDVVVQTMDDYVIVIDSSLRILGLNAVAKERFEADGESVVGKFVMEVFEPWMGQLSGLVNSEEGQVEVRLDFEGETYHIDIHISPLVDRENEQLGQVFVARNITHQKEMEHKLRDLNTNLENIVQARTQELEAAYDSTLEGWAKALEIRDKETEGHSRRVTELSVKLAKEIGLGEEDIEHIRRGALLHDIGKMAIPDDILNKPDSLTPAEMDIMKQHPVIAEQLLSHISYLNRALEIPRYHHERWDGTGYPNGISGEKIPLSARIFSLVDHYDALVSDRPYRKAWKKDEAMKYIREQRGAIFDPNLTDEFLRMLISGSKAN
ncbi:MAG: histidine kinase N-terminal 7TM domain-containing protein, partial [Anaerolineales bacterium]